MANTLKVGGQVGMDVFRSQEHTLTLDRLRAALNTGTQRSDLSHLSDTTLPRRLPADCNTLRKWLVVRSARQAASSSDALCKSAIPAQYHVAGRSVLTDAPQLFPSPKPTSRAEVLMLADAMDDMLRTATSPRRGDVLPRSSLGDDLCGIVDEVRAFHSQSNAVVDCLCVVDIAFSEIIRHVTVQCAERGNLLQHVRQCLFGYTKDVLNIFQRSQVSKIELHEELNRQGEDLANTQARLVSAHEEVAKAQAEIRRLERANNFNKTKAARDRAMFEAQEFHVDKSKEREEESTLADMIQTARNEQAFVRRLSVAAPLMTPSRFPHVRDRPIHVAPKVDAFMMTDDIRHIIPLSMLNSGAREGSPQSFKKISYEASSQTELPEERSAPVFDFSRMSVLGLDSRRPSVSAAPGQSINTRSSIATARKSMVVTSNKRGSMLFPKFDGPVKTVGTETDRAPTRNVHTQTWVKTSKAPATPITEQETPRSPMRKAKIGSLDDNAVRSDSVSSSPRMGSVVVPPLADDATPPKNIPSPLVLSSTEDSVNPIASSIFEVLTRKKQDFILMDGGNNQPVIKEMMVPRAGDDLAPTPHAKARAAQPAVVLMTQSTDLSLDVSDFTADSTRRSDDATPRSSDGDAGSLLYSLGSSDMPATKKSPSSLHNTKWFFESLFGIHDFAMKDESRQEMPVRYFATRNSSDLVESCFADFAALMIPFVEKKHPRAVIAAQCFNMCSLVNVEKDPRMSGHAYTFFLLVWDAFRLRHKQVNKEFHEERRCTLASDQVVSTLDFVFSHLMGPDAKRALLDSIAAYMCGDKVDLLLASVGAIVESGVVEKGFALPHDRPVDMWDVDLLLLLLTTNYVGTIHPLENPRYFVSSQQGARRPQIPVKVDVSKGVRQTPKTPSRQDPLPPSPVRLNKEKAPAHDETLPSYHLLPSLKQQLSTKPSGKDFGRSK